MLFNSYVKPFGEVSRRFGVRWHQYADDTQLYLSISTSAWFQYWNGPALRLNLNKTKILPLEANLS